MRSFFTPLTLFLVIAPLAACIDDSAQPLEPTLSRVAPEARYEVGFTYYLIQDPARSNRQIPVYVWYPVEASSITAATTPAQYPLEPFKSLLPVASSTAFEQTGLGAAWHDAPAADGPFPLIMFTTGWGIPAYAGAMFLATEIVRHGFVVASTTHWGDCAAPLRVTGEPSVKVGSFNREGAAQKTLVAVFAHPDDAKYSPVKSASDRATCEMRRCCVVARGRGRA